MNQGTIVLVIGIAAVLLGGYTLFLNIFKRVKCTQETEAEIVDVKKERHKTGSNRRTDYTPVLSYKVDGQEYGGLTQFSSILPNKFQVGQTMKVKYDPSNPDNFCVVGKVGNIKLSVFALVIGAAFIVVSIL